MKPLSEELLDNPIFNSLADSHHHFAEGKGNALFYPSDIAPFAGLINNTKDDFNLLHSESEAEQSFAVFSRAPYQDLENWTLIGQIDMLQLVYRKKDKRHPKMQIVDLNENHVEEMINLVKLTEPGPFRNKTIKLGNYTGIFQNDRLVAMAGQRFNPKPYVEISAVCTHPNFIGRGFASEILKEQINRIVSTEQIPFLHVREDNKKAIEVYQRLGFSVRCKMYAYILKRMK